MLTTLIHCLGKLFLTLLTTSRVCTSEQGHGRPHLVQRDSKTARLELEDQLSRYYLWANSTRSQGMLFLPIDSLPRLADGSLGRLLHFEASGVALGTGLANLRGNMQDLKGRTGEFPLGKSKEGGDCAGPVLVRKSNPTTCCRVECN